MKERIHKRLPAAFVVQVLESFNSHKISEKEVAELLGIKRGRLYQLRQRWLRGDGNQPLVLWQRDSSAFHVISEEVKQWLEKELRYIRQQAYTFRGKFNFAFLAEEAEKVFGRRFNRNSIRLYALKSGMVYTGKRQAQAKGKVEKIFDYFQRRLPYLTEKYKIKDCAGAQKILDELVSYYNEQRIHEETKEIPIIRWQNAIAQGKGRLKPLDADADLDMIFSIHLKRKTRKDGSIMFKGKNWRIGCPQGATVTICLIPTLKFMVYKDNKKIWEVHL